MWGRFTMLSVNIYDIRKQNLGLLLRESGMPLGEFAKQTGVSAIYLTQVLSAKTQRHMGDKVARRIENKRDLPPGWMDAITSPTMDLSDTAINLALKFDKLPARVQERIAAEIDTLYRFTSGN